MHVFMGKYSTGAKTFIAVKRNVDDQLLPAEKREEKNL